MTRPSTHPVQDGRVGDLATVTRLEGPVIAWSEHLSDLVARMRRSSPMDIVVVIPEASRLTPAFDRLSQDAGLIVLVEEADGYRQLRAGWYYPTLREAVEAATAPRRRGPASAPATTQEPPAAQAGARAGAPGAGAPSTDMTDMPDIMPDISVDFLQPSQTVPHLLVSASMFQPARRSTSLGRTVELVVEHLLDKDAEISWGRYEPAGASWDRDALTTLSRRLMPKARVTLAAHSDHGIACGTLTMLRTSSGVEEYTELVVAPSALSLPSQEQVSRSMGLLSTLAVEARPQFVLTARTYGHPDTSLPVTVRTPPTPLTLAIGAGGIHLLGLDPQTVADRHDGTVIGRGRKRGVAVPLDSGRPGDWTSLFALLPTLDSQGRLHQVLRGTRAPAQPPAPGGTYPPGQPGTTGPGHTGRPGSQPGQAGGASAP
ncbi:DUF6177 family protein [Actinomyces wuliandei]|uniref:DUF6177 family protein n=1 Tax=Actinomyces wuliandei TaxID=2057743 RepID=UPI00111AB670|nr:DUF6177 family protein [Actinomyces wuliandei]